MAPERGQRQRIRKVTLACEPCRERKARCDGGKPICSTCQRRSLGLEQCVYKLANAKTSCSDDYTKALHERIRQLEQACALHGVNLSTVGVDNAPTQPGAQQNKAPDNEQPGTIRGAASSVAPVGDMSQDQFPSPTSNSNEGNGVSAMGTIVSADVLDRSPDDAQDFFGKSSTASFLKEMCGTMSPRPANVPIQVPQNRALVSGRPASLANVQKFILPPRHFADHLIKRYFQRVFYLYPFFHRPAFEHAYQTLWQTNSDIATPAEYHGVGLGSSPGADSSTIVFHAALNAIFALGCNFSDLAPSEKMPAAELFLDRAKDLIGIGMLDVNNLGVVQAMLLAALVLQGTPFPDRCWNSVGVAGRVAQGIGLHTDGTEQPGESLEKQVRRRTWHGCIILDTFVSMTFGRPTLITNLSTLSLARSTHDDTISSHDVERMKFQFHQESIYLSVVLESILSKIYQPWLSRNEPPPAGSNVDNNLETIMELDAQLASFEQSVPSFLSWKAHVALDQVSLEDQAVFDLQRNVLHARFLYIRLMLHRSILTQLTATNIAAQHEAKRKESLPKQPQDHGLRLSFKLDCAKQCVKVAIQLINSVYDTYETKATSAWWWNGLYACTSGLILIVCRLCNPLWASLDHDEISVAWGRCQNILQNLAGSSFSARKSLDLLLGINENIASKQAAKGRDHEDIPRGHAVEHDIGPVDNSWPLQDDPDFTFQLDPDMMGSFFNGWEALDFMTIDQ